MAVELVNWIEIPVLDMARARVFYESVFDIKLMDLQVGVEIYPCFPNKNADGFSGALVQYDFTKPGKQGPLVYLNAYAGIDAMMERIAHHGGQVVQGKTEIAPGFGHFALFEDSEGNLLALQA
ncbi:MAG TPA: VOC family protein [Cytophagales bacterium]|nr:VOC family protein [Cytophagales bacterium]